MNEIFANIYEFGGLLPFYSSGLGDHLRGYDATCSGYFGTPYYAYVGIVMLGLTTLGYLLQYHIIDSYRYNGRLYWWLNALVICSLNFIFAYTVTLNAIHSNEVCKQLHISAGDIFGFGIANAIITFLLFLLITSVPYIRAFSINCKYTTFWKP